MLAFTAGHLKVLASRVRGASRPDPSPLGRHVRAGSWGVLFVRFFRSFFLVWGNGQDSGQSLSPWETMLAQGVFRRFHFLTLRAAGELERFASSPLD